MIGHHLKRSGSLRVCAVEIRKERLVIFRCGPGPIGDVLAEIGNRPFHDPDRQVSELPWRSKVLSLIASISAGTPLGVP